MLALTAVVLLFVGAAPFQDPSAGDTSVAKAAATCVGQIASYPNAPAVYQLVPDSNVPAGVAGGAEAGWNASSCNQNGDSFPTFTSNLTPGATPVPVHFQSGVNQQNPTVCGQFSGATGAITLYGQAQRPDGSTGTCGSGTALIQSLEHEMGHRLGLADQYGAACQGHIMSQVAFPAGSGAGVQPLPRSIMPDECSEAGASNTTPGEKPPPPPPPAVCPPDCSCPDTCLTGCNVNGVCEDDPCDIDPECGGGGPGGACGDFFCEDSAPLPSRPPTFLRLPRPPRLMA